MITATYFGEITELDSRAVWYSDEEDSDEDDDEQLEHKTTPKIKPIGPVSHDTFRSDILANYERLLSCSGVNLSYCIISLVSSAQFKNYPKSFGGNSSHLLGCFGSLGRALAIPAEQQDQVDTTVPGQHVLWLMFDSSHPYVSGFEIGYFVETLRETIQAEFPLDTTTPLLILSSQFSDSDQLEYLSNSSIVSLPLSGRPILPPCLIKNQFESALFEQFTLSLRPAMVVCLPNPRNFSFDKAKHWPQVPDQIIEPRFSEDSLGKTLIFT